MDGGEVVERREESGYVDPDDAGHGKGDGEKDRGDSNREASVLEEGIELVIPYSQFSL